MLLNLELAEWNEDKERFERVHIVELQLHFEENIQAKQSYKSAPTFMINLRRYSQQQMD